MPNYEYHCRACDRVFAMTMRVNEHDTAEVHCPSTQRHDLGNPHLA